MGPVRGERSVRRVVDSKIQQTIDDLQAVGLAAGRGYPAAKIRVLKAPMVMVSLHRYTPKELVLAADVYAPAALGGDDCEYTALQVAQVLTGKMASCTVEDCGFMGPAGLFKIRVLAHWDRELGYDVMVDQRSIGHVTACSAVRNTVQIPYVDSSGGDAVLSVTGRTWDITVTDLWPLGQRMEPETTEEFTLFVMRPSGAEAYPGCKWIKHTLEETPAGVLRTRVAQTVQERALAGG